MLGLPEFRVLASVEVEGELELLVETAAGRDWCRSCGVRARAHGRREVVVRDVAAFGCDNLKWPRCDGHWNPPGLNRFPYVP